MANTKKPASDVGPEVDPKYPRMMVKDGWHEGARNAEEERDLLAKGFRVEPVVEKTVSPDRRHVNTPVAVERRVSQGDRRRVNTPVAVERRLSRQ